MTLSNLTYPAYLRSLNIPSDASHVLDYFTGEEIQTDVCHWTGEPFIDLVHTDHDIDNRPSQQRAKAVLWCNRAKVDEFIKEKGNLALPWLVTLGFSEYDAACMCWNAGIQTEHVIQMMNRTI